MLEKDDNENKIIEIINNDTDDSGSGTESGGTKGPNDLLTKIETKSGGGTDSGGTRGPNK
jgi:hypothetical protein